jgi:hypothetical protein
MDLGASPLARGPGFTLQFLSANSGRLRDFRFNPLRTDASCQYPTPDKATAKAKKGRKTTENTEERREKHRISPLFSVVNFPGFCSLF